MEGADEPVGYFITWTVYGTFLQGDRRWWKKNGVSRSPQPLLEKWHRDRLSHDVIQLTYVDREIIRQAIEAHCRYRSWKLWVANPRSNHVHVVVTSPGYLGTKVRDQLKANATGRLRRHDHRFADRPVWTAKGDVEVLDTQDDLEQAIIYASEAQDRMDRGKYS